VRIELHAPGDVLPLAFSPDGKTLATTGAEGILLWDVADGRRRSTWTSQRGHFVMSGTFAPDGRTFVSQWIIRRSAIPCTVELVDVATGRVRSTMTARRGCFYGYAFAADGRSLRLIDRGTVGADVVDCDLATGRQSRRPFAGATSFSFSALSPDGRTLASVPVAATAPRGLSADAILWDVERDREVARLPGLPGGPGIRAFEFSPDGSNVAIGRLGGSIELWDVGTRRRRSTFRGHPAGFDPMVIRFAPDGTALASLGSADGRSPTLDTLRVRAGRLLGSKDWDPIIEVVVLDTATGRRLGLAPSEVRTEFSPDGRTLATAFTPDGKNPGVSPLDLAVRLRTIPGRPRVVAPRRAPGG